LTRAENCRRGRQEAQDRLGRRATTFDYQSARRVHAEYPHLPLDLIEDKVITWLETFAPETYSSEQLDELDRLTEQWVDDHERHQDEARSEKLRRRTPHS
jgi:hypothetical protein